MTEKLFKCTNISENGMEGLFWLGKDNLSVYDVVRTLNELYEENEQLKSEYKVLHTRHQNLNRFVENNFDEYMTQEKFTRKIKQLEQSQASTLREFEKGIKKIQKLVKENEDLKQQREELFIRERDTKNELRELKYENENLRENNYGLLRKLIKFFDKVLELEEENKQLKKQIKELQE